MKLDEFHILNTCLRTVCHGYSVTGCNRRICGGSVDLPVPTGCKKGGFGNDLFNLVRQEVKSIHAVTFNIGGCLCNQVSEVVLCNQVKYEAMFDDVNVGHSGDLLYKGTFHFHTGNIL